MEVYENLTKPLIDYYSSINYVNKDQNDHNSDQNQSSSQSHQNDHNSDQNENNSDQNPSFLSFEFKNGVKDYPILKSEIDDLFS